MVVSLDRKCPRPQTRLLRSRRLTVHYFFCGCSNPRQMTCCPDTSPLGLPYFPKFAFGAELSFRPNSSGRVVGNPEATFCGHPISGPGTAFWELGQALGCSVPTVVNDPFALHSAYTYAVRAVSSTTFGLSSWVVLLEEGPPFASRAFSIESLRAPCCGCTYRLVMLMSRCPAT